MKKVHCHGVLFWKKTKRAFFEPGQRYKKSTEVPQNQPKNNQKHCKNHHQTTKKNCKNHHKKKKSTPLPFWSHTIHPLSSVQAALPPCDDVDLGGRVLHAASDLGTERSVSAEVGGATEPWGSK